MNPRGARRAPKGTSPSKATARDLKPVVLRSALRGKSWASGITATLGPREPAPTHRRACLVVLAGPGEGALHKLKATGELTIGRGEEADIRLDDDGVSRLHARIISRGGEVVIEDLESRNGTYVGENAIDHHQLATEDIIRVGATTVIKFCYIDTLEEGFRKRLLDAALHDALTGCYNRRNFDERLATECATARRHKRPLTLLLIDIDDFKAVNDQHGHPAGDAVLRGVARALRDGLRREDLPFRYGGEEFAVLLRETERAGASRLAERLRKKIERCAFPTGEGTGPALAITISVGVAVFDGTVGDARFVQIADEALYEAKRSGKNRVVRAK